jgi:solute carrier family 29 (equilibrative nucleoside transporter), member 1/2/3
LFPWNTFINAAHYYAMRFCGTAFEGNFENYFSVAFMISQTTGLALAIKYQDHIPLQYRVLVPLCLTAGVFVFTTVSVTIDIDRNFLFVLTLLSCMIVGISNAMLSGGLFGLCANFPPKYTGALMSGQGLAGLTVSIASISTTWIGNAIDVCTDDDSNDGDDDGSCENSVDYSALIFFCITCVVMGTCVFSFLALMALPFTQ